MKYIWLILLFFLIIATDCFAQSLLNPDDRNVYVQQATSLFAENKWAKGKETINEGLNKYSKDPDLRCLNGKYYLHVKDYESARYELKKSLEYDPKNVAAKQTLITVEMATGRYSSAISYVNELLEVIPYDKNLWMKKAEAYRLQGNIIESNRLIMRIRLIYPEDATLKENMIDYLYEEFRSKKGKASPDELEELALYVINEDPQNEEVFLELINCFLQAGNYDKALLYAQRGTLNMPYSMNLIRKRNSILAHQHRYQDILTLTKAAIKEQGNTPALSQENDYYMEEAAQYARKSDSYFLFQSLFQKHPGNVAYFNQVYTTALSRLLYDDAIEAIKSAKKARGETKDLLLKEQYIYERLGNRTRQQQVVYRLAELYPTDKDISDEKSVYMYREAKELMADQMYLKAIPLLDYVIENGGEELSKPASMAKYNCWAELGRVDEAELAINQLIEEHPQEADLRFKKSALSFKKNQYLKSLKEYEEGLEIVAREGDSTDYYKIGYEEQATVYMKELLDSYRLDEAMVLADRWLTVVPESKIAPRYGYNVSSQMRNNEKAKIYLTHGLSMYPDETYFQLKLADVYIKEKNYDSASGVLSPLLKKYPYHQEAIATYSQLSLDQSKVFLKESKTNDALDVLNRALTYDPDNIDLKYMKGSAYERIHQSDSAYYYKSFYSPSLMELAEHKQNLKHLSYTKYKNEVAFSVQPYFFTDETSTISVASAEYSRIMKKDVLTGRFFYSGRETQQGAMLQGEWEHQFSSVLTGSLLLGKGMKVFPDVIVSPTVYYTFAPTWELQMALGYRYMADHKNLFNQQAGVSKEFYFGRLTGKFNSVILDKQWCYNVTGMARFYLNSQSNYLTAMGSIGTAPDIESMDNLVYKSFDITNTMVGIGAHIIVSDRCSIDPVGSWYNYKISNDLRKNVYSLLLKVNIRF